MVRKSAERQSFADGYTLASPPDTTDIDELRQAAGICQSCPLWRAATGTVFGEGPIQARVMLVGEQPGDQEDRTGKPFSGPAGKVLDRALEQAGVRREELYVTNAVKHFKWEPRGKRRIHKTPNSRDIASCRPWLLAEIRAVRPELLVCLGATAVRSILELELPVLENRGRIVQSPHGIRTLVTVHPSSLLRLPDPTQREVEYGRFVEDLRLIHS
jgi:DNA polymerase